MKKEHRVSLGILSSMASGQAAVALALDGELCRVLLCGRGQRASQSILPTIDALLNDQGIRVGELDDIAVARGPGSFTGIRVGLASVYGLSRVCKARSLAFSTLHLMALCSMSEGLVFSIIPAGRGDCFLGEFEKRGKEVEEIAKPRLLLRGELERVDFSKATLVTEQESLASVGEAGAASMQVIDVESCAAAAAKLAAMDDCPRYPLEPIYLRRSWAEEVEETREKARK